MSAASWRRRLATLVVIGCLGPVALAYEPEMVELSLTPVASEGTVDVAQNLLGDDILLVEVGAVPGREEQWTLLVFDGINEDPPPAGRPVRNLREVLERGARPDYAPRSDRDPAWRAFPVLPQLTREQARPVADELRQIVSRDGQIRIAQAFLLPPGEKGWFVAVIDFLKIAHRGYRPRISGRAYALDAGVVEGAGGDANNLAQIARRRGFDNAAFALEWNYRLDGERWTSGEFEKIFGAPTDEIAGGFETRDYKADAATLPVAVESYRSDLKIPGNTSEPGRGLFEQTMREISEAGSGEAGDTFCLREELHTGPRDDPPTDKTPVYIIRGRYSTRWASDHSLHPGFGWVAEAWTYGNGSWRKLTESWVQADGRFTLYIINVPFMPYNGEHLRIVYRAANRYFATMNKEEHVYKWHDPDRYDIPPVLDVGHRWAEIDGGSASGLGEVYHAAYVTWSRLYWLGGINPIRDEPIRFYYPNTWETCGVRTTPWSCASPDGRLWIIPEHADRAFATSHELGHQLNYEYWNDKLPANSGGSHSTAGCFPNRLGMVLTEAFADFVAAWVGYPSRYVAEGPLTGYPWDTSFAIENHLGQPYCYFGWDNEGWVARTFWDLHDTRSDGDDLLFFTKMGAVIGIYLSHGVANNGDPLDMRDFRPIYKLYASQGHEGYIDQIFDQNKQ